MGGFIEYLIVNYGIYGIFIASVLSYSIIPMPPLEGFIILSLNYLNPYSVFITLLLGSTIGSIINYFIGLKGVKALLGKRYIKRKKVAEKIFDKWGYLSIVLFGWTPIFGNVLIILCGTLKMKFSKFLLYSTIGKVWYFILIIWFGSILTLSF